MFRKQLLSLLGSLLIICVTASIGAPSPADAQEVHALLIILGNERKIRESVDVNREKLVTMFRELSHHCDVHLTIMHSENVSKGTVSRQTFTNGEGDNVIEKNQDIIKSRQVVAWVENLTPAANDTIFVYYCGHGAIGSYDTHYLFFDDVNNDILTRDKLSRAVKGKPARLRILITDTCSNRLSQEISDELFARYNVGIRTKARSYIEDLFLAHEGILDITAASPDQFAIAHNELGGHFTSSLISQGFTAVADKNGDSFLSWDEAFTAARKGTMELHGKTPFGPEIAEQLEEKGQKTQEPFAHTLPKRKQGGGGDVSPQVPTPTLSTATLNFTSTPSGAEVEIDGFVVGKTPLQNYEIETDGSSTKDIEVTIKASGYEDAVKKFRVRRGTPFSWEFELQKEELPKIAAATIKIHMLIVTHDSGPAITDALSINRSKLRKLASHAIMPMFDAELRKPGSASIEFWELESTSEDYILRWFHNVRPGPNDVVFFYYAGPGSVDAKGESYLALDGNTPTPRHELVKSMERLECRLKILITDTDRVEKQTVDVLIVVPQQQESAVPQPTVYRASPIDSPLGSTRIIRNLFLEHEGFLHLTSSSLNQYSWVDNASGFYFTNAFFNAITSDKPNKVDRDPQDGFVSWSEVFELTKEKVAVLIKQTIPSDTTRELLKKGQTPEALSPFPKQLLMIKLADPVNYNKF